VLKHIGATVFHAYDGMEAIEKLEENKIDVAIIDIVMPKKNGVDVVQKAKSLYPETIFVAYTADIIRHNYEVCKELGFNQCFAKPILPVKLISGINRLLIPIRNSYK
jgi:CheY-like chemotaxis protein